MAKEATTENNIQRESLGIPEVDDMINGGVPNESIVGISGPPGVGKSIMSLHFVLEGARQGKKSVYINLEEPRSNIDNMINQFSFAKELYKYEKSGLITIKCFDYNEYERIYEHLFESINEDKTIKHLVIDSFNCFFNAMQFSNDSEAPMNVKKAIAEVFYKLRRSNLTTILTLEKYENSGNGNCFNNIPYLVDGMIQLDFLNFGLIERRIFIPKMRWTKQFKESKSYEISKNGIIVEDDDIEMG